MSGRLLPEYEGPPDHPETNAERIRRADRNRLARNEHRLFVDARCASCGHVRFNVVHEMDPEHSIEGPEYHADIVHHPFEEPR